MNTVTREKIHLVSVIYDLSTPGGAEQFLLDYARNFNHHRYELTILSLKSVGDKEKSLKDTEANVEALYIDPLRTRHIPSALIPFMAKIQLLNPDIIHSHLWKTNVITRLTATMLNIPIVVTAHNSYPDRAEWMRMINHFLSHLTTHIVSVSASVRQYLHKKERIIRDNMSVIHNGIPLASFQGADKETNLRDEWNIPRNAHLLINVGSLRRQKGQQYLIEAFEYLRQENLHLLIVGTGTLDDQLKSQVKKAGLRSNIHFAGHRSDIPELLQASDTFVFPSLWEGNPLALMEAMASGLPVVATDIPANRELITDEKNGYLCKSKHPKSIAHNISKLINNPDRAKRMASIAQSTIEENYTIQKSVKQYERLFAELVE